MGSTGSGTTMGHTNAMHSRLAQLQSMGQNKSAKKKSFDVTKSLKRTKSQINRDRYYSIATTKQTELKKIDNERQQQRQQMVIQQNRRMKKYIQSQSRKNVLDGVSNKDDEKERMDTIDDD